MIQQHPAWKEFLEIFYLFLGNNQGIITEPGIRIQNAVIVEECRVEPQSPFENTPDRNGGCSQYASNFHAGP